MRRKRGPVALCAQPFGWLTFVEVSKTLLLSGAGVQGFRPSPSPGHARLGTLSPGTGSEGHRGTDRRLSLSEPRAGARGYVHPRGSGALAGGVRPEPARSPELISGSSGQGRQISRAARTSMPLPPPGESEPASLDADMKVVAPSVPAWNQIYAVVAGVSHSPAR